MQRPRLSVVARNGSNTAEYHGQIEDAYELVEEIEIEQRGWPKVKFFASATEDDLHAQVEHWIDQYCVNPAIAGVAVMSPTVSADGKFRVAVNYLLFEDNVDPWS